MTQYDIHLVHAIEEQISEWRDRRGARGRRVRLGETPARLVAEQSLACTSFPVLPQVMAFSPVIKTGFPQWPSAAESYSRWEGTSVSQPGMYRWSLWMSQSPRASVWVCLTTPLGVLMCSPDEPALESL